MPAVCWQSYTLNSAAHEFGMVIRKLLQALVGRGKGEQRQYNGKNK